MTCLDCSTRYEYDILGRRGSFEGMRVTRRRTSNIDRYFLNRSRKQPLRVVRKISQHRSTVKSVELAWRRDLFSALVFIDYAKKGATVEPNSIFSEGCLTTRSFRTHLKCSVLAPFPFWNNRALKNDPHPPLCELNTLRLCVLQSAQALCMQRLSSARGCQIVHLSLFRLGAFRKAAGDKHRRSWPRNICYPSFPLIVIVQQ